jgi:hypothetical protein
MVGTAMRNLLSALTVLLILVLAAAMRGQLSPARPLKPLTLSQVWALDATYTDPDHGVTFRYPSIWRAATQFGYIPPALSTLVEKPIAGFAYDHLMGPYTATNLQGFGIVYSAIPAADFAECKTFAASLSETPTRRTIVLGSRSFWVYETSEGAMMSVTSGNLYATYAKDTCYLFETGVAATSEKALDNVPPLPPAQHRSIDQHMLNIMKSVRIVPR